LPKDGSGDAIGNNKADSSHVGEQVIGNKPEFA